MATSYIKRDRGIKATGSATLHLAEGANQIVADGVADPNILVEGTMPTSSSSLFIVARAYTSQNETVDFSLQ